MDKCNYSKKKKRKRIPYQFIKPRKKRARERRKKKKKENEIQQRERERESKRGLLIVPVMELNTTVEEASTQILTCGQITILFAERINEVTGTSPSQPFVVPPKFSERFPSLS